MKSNSWIFTPKDGPDDWRRLLGNPEKHWPVGYSAHSMAHAWEGVKGLLESVQDFMISQKMMQSWRYGQSQPAGLVSFVMEFLKSDFQLEMKMF